MSDSLGELLADKESLESEIAALEWKLVNVKATLRSDEEIITSHRRMEVDMLIDLAVKRSLLEAVDDELSAMAEEVGDVEID